MLWWDWSWKQRGGTLACFFAIAIMPFLIFGGSSFGWRAMIGGTAFLLIPQIVGWLLFVGLKTGIMPARGAKVERNNSPVGFWTLAAAYGGLLAMYGWIFAMVASDAMSGR
ncbi:hypothetical protein [Novosphingobium pokkalii]|uniref:Uncharacterized protein n=1 Tax=Novosphingobium pokkalii TaxID=1770194 RepID=A0ABV7V8Z4_9SPHN|nr:hypothetical protein [Novosphingobium pokkalii]GHD02181.1 hypothetical protein GCM10019060_37340 [Novosphingobium pokkalii]